MVRRGVACSVVGWSCRVAGQSEGVDTQLPDELNRWKELLDRHWG
jgi:hypothetical protein